MFRKVPLVRVATVGAMLVFILASCSEIFGPQEDLVVSAPTFNLAAGEYTTPQTVVLSSSTRGAQILFTTNGETPSPLNGTVYTSPLPISATTTVKALAVKSGWTSSRVVTRTFTFPSMPKLANPVFTPDGGTMAPGPELTITATNGAAIRYSVTIIPPSATSGTLYQGPIPLDFLGTITFQAIAYKEGFLDSDVVSRTFTIQKNQLSTPVISPSGGTFPSTQSVTLTSDDPLATIYYTVNGTEPSFYNGTEYSYPFLVSTTTIVTAVAVRAGWTDSALATKTFTITIPETLAKPTISPAGGTFTEATTVTLTSDTPDAKIYYTINGDIVSESTGILYQDPLVLTSSATLQAIAVKDGWFNSPIATNEFIVNVALPVAAPVISPDGGSFFGSQSVTLTTTTPFATIIYTTNGNDPNLYNSSTYDNPIVLTATTTLKARAVRTGWLDSPVVSKEFTLNVPQPVADPTVLPDGGTFPSAATVTLASATIGADIYYTLDGTTPSATHGTHYLAPFQVSSTMTVKAVAVKSGMVDSQTVTKTFTINTGSGTGGIAVTIQ